MAPVNLISDTQTRPTEGMRAAMAGAEVGDEQKLDDPTTSALQERVAELLGQEAALFLPSGTMCNLIACKLHVGPAGEEIILAANSHVASFEAGGAGAITHAMTRQIDAPTGIFSGAQVEAAVRPAGDRYSPDSAMVSVEQTTNMGGGRVWPLAAVREVLEVARARELRAHLDGARLMNAAVASGDDAAAFAAGFDTAWIDFSKGLGAPVGAVLASSAELIERAWRWKQMFGGSMRQSGVLAAACMHALDYHVDRLRRGPRERARSRRRPRGAARRGHRPLRCRDQHRDLRGGGRCGAGHALAQDDVLVGPLNPRRMRAVTHLDVDAAGVEARWAFQRALSAYITPQNPPPAELGGFAQRGRSAVASLPRRAKGLLLVQEGPRVRQQPQPLDGRHPPALQPQPSEGPHRRGRISVARIRLYPLPQSRQSHQGRLRLRISASSVARAEHASLPAPARLRRPWGRAA